MHILLVTPYYPHSNDPSSGIFIHRQAVALQKRGHHVEIFHYWRKQPFWRRDNPVRQPWSGMRDLELDGLRVHRIAYYWPDHAILDYWWCRQIANALYKAIKPFRNQKSTVIYAQWLLPTAAACQRLASSLQIPIIGIARGYDLHVLPKRSKALKNELQTVWAKTDLILTNGQWAFQPLQELGFDIEERQIQIVRNIHDLCLYDQLKPAHFHKTLRLVTVASLEPRKGIDVLIRAIAEIEGKIDVHLTIIGNGSQRENLELLSEQLGVRELLTFLGTVDQAEILQTFSHSHVFILPSRRDGMPNALIEAMAAGLGCIASNVGGIPYLIDDGVSGCLVEPGNPAALAKAIIELGTSATKRLPMGVSARKRMRELYSYEKNTDRLEFALASVAKSG